MQRQIITARDLASSPDARNSARSFLYVLCPVLGREQVHTTQAVEEDLPNNPIVGRVGGECLHGGGDTAGLLGVWSLSHKTLPQQFELWGYPPCCTSEEAVNPFLTSLCRANLAN